MSDTSGHCIVIGGSHAAAQLTQALRQKGWQGAITMVSAENCLPYHRPPLSKTFLAGDKSEDDILIRSAEAYEHAHIELLLGRRVVRIDRATKQVQLDDGRSLSYSKLALTTGARVRRLKLPGSDLPGVLYLRDITDARRIMARLGSTQRAVIVGGGYIGLETAASLRKLHVEVTVLEALPRILQRVTAPEVAAFYARVHGEEGVSIRTGVQLEAIEGGTDVTGLRCVDGERIPADLVIVGIGIEPETSLADAAGLRIVNGIEVDEFARTSDDNIVAAGDCTYHYNPLYDTRLRLESVQNAMDQANVAANTLCGNPSPYDALPWFWSDQYDIKLQIAGLSQGFDQVVVRGSTASGRSFAAFYMRQGRLIAVDAINRPKEFMLGKRALMTRCMPNIAKLADEKIDVQEIFKP
jgi:3-phenylpropionate/trans-cinnamate dioxygenase ferredoxin reductase component